MEVSSMNENESIEFKENYTEKIYKDWTQILELYILDMMITGI